ncbi:MAG: T9SS type A sorting domain-containing protein [Bacteroidia bacterium]|nr:T9SS type A sorting domain-containing protein [Bacteroidia bacterium]
MMTTNKAFPFLFVFGLIALTIGTSLNSHLKNVEHTAPGYADQFFQMKQNENGELPRSMWKQWTSETPVFHGKIDFFDEVNEIGPSNIGGRTRAMIVDYSNTNHLIAGGVSGGIWNSTDGGRNWKALDDQASTLSITGITQSPFNPKEIYYSTGELTNGTHVNYDGNGIFKSTDGGLSFAQLDSSDIIAFDKTWDIEHSKTDSNTIYVATILNGLYRSTDKGKTFHQLYKTGSAVNDVDAMEDGTVYFSVYGQGIFTFEEKDTVDVERFTNIGVTGFGRCLVEASPSNRNIIYAAFANSNRESLRSVYKSTNGGQDWSEISNPQDIGVWFNQIWHNMVLSVHPTNPNFVVCSGVTSGYSTNGGSTWRFMANGHADYHDAVFVPGTNDFYMLNDGGIYKHNTATAGDIASDRNTGYNVTQLYAGSFNPSGDEVLVGAQDNWTTTNNNGTSVFSQVLGGDGAFNAIDKTGEYIYASSQNGNIRRWSGTRWVNIYNTLRSVVGSNDFWFINPFEINPEDGTQIYFPTKNVIARSTDRGTRWTEITNSIPGSIFSVAMTPEDNPTLYFGGQSGILYRIDNAKTATAGNSFKMFTLAPALARGGFIGNIEIDPNDHSTIYLAMSNYSAQPRIWKVEDADTESPKWTDISGNLPGSLPVNWIEVDPANSDNIMAATDYGLYVTGDGGRFWHKEEAIPNVYIPMIRLRESDRKLFAFTFGRGVWSASLNEEVSTSVEDVAESSSPAVYPNPATDYLHLSGFTGNKAEIINASGSRLTVDVDVRQNAQIQDLIPGIYFVRYESESGFQVARFIKQ